MLGGSDSQFILLPVVFVALVGDGGAGLVIHNLIGAGGNGVGGHLVGGGFIGGLGDDGAFHQQALQIAGSQGGEVEPGHVVAQHFHAVHGAQFGQIAVSLGGVKAELDVAGGQLVACLVYDVIVDFHVVGQVVHLGQLFHQAADEAVAVLDHQHFIGGEQDTDTAKAHALEGADVAGIASQADHDGRTLLGRGEACHGQNHDQSKNDRQELFHGDTFLSICSLGSVLIAKRLILSA